MNGKVEGRIFANSKGRKLDEKGARACKKIQLQSSTTRNEIDCSRQLAAIVK